jgi:methylated-DNA-protein-cysteine methyltransferase-like protein
VTFATAVYAVVRRIPRGCVATYGEIAARLGRPRGARAVGQALGHCPPGIPWHRVVNARGGISPRARASGMLTQRIRLEQEGVGFRHGCVPLSRYAWRELRRLPVLGRGRQRSEGMRRNRTATLSG